MPPKVKDLMLSSLIKHMVRLPQIAVKTTPPKNTCGTCTRCTCITNEPSTCGPASDAGCLACSDMAMVLASWQAALAISQVNQAKRRAAKPSPKPERKPARKK